MKNSLLLILIFFATILSAQEKQITKLLNGQLRKEIQNYTGLGDSLILTKPFTIDENEILSFEISRFDFENNEKEFVRQEVQLNKITGFIKDINVIFETEKDAVTVTSIKYDRNGREISNETHTYHLFFTEINREKENENFRNKILKAFSRAGYKLNSEFWAD